MKLSLLLWIVTVSLIVAIDYWAVDAVVVVAEATDISNNSTADANIGSTLLSLSDHDLIDDEEEEEDELQQHDTDDYINGSITNDVVLVEEEKKVGIADQYNNSNNYGCDESKCVSTGLSWTLFNDAFTCYAFDNYNHMVCADGYKPRFVENETTVYYGGYDYQYFTCCPPNLSSDVKVSRHCSNSTSVNNGWEDPNNDTMVCDDTTKTYPRWGDDDDDDVNKLANKPYPRKMKTSGLGIESYVCCDYNTPNENENGNHNTNFLDEIECVPYINEFYVESWTRNMYGMILPAFCDEPESGFQFPRYVEHNKTSRIHYFECCKTDPGSPPFTQDYFFKITVYPQIVISAIAVISSMVLIVALSLPLFSSLRSQSTRTRTTTTTRSTNARTRSQTTTEPAYSSYNLYMVFLAIPDLILNLYLVIMYGSYANQEFNPNFYGNIIYTFGRNYSTFEGAFILACSTANLFLNCVVAHEILILLRNIHLVIRCDPPSFLKVTLQATAVYLFSITVYFIHYFIGRAANQAYDEFMYDRYLWLTYANLTWSLLVTYVFPILFFVYVWITIKCRGYMPSLTGRMKELVYFFFRIVFVFCIIWLPGMAIVTYGAATQTGFWTQIGLLFCGIQPIVSACMAMSKSDVRKYTMDLITLSYIRTSSACITDTRRRPFENTNDNSS